ncbi:hypothetical protein LTR12_002608 [Friedmanniomyces endolithicus]|nr:hypothetical protein LTR12_002608 [Friedmanniomyces endolithicus]
MSEYNKPPGYDDVYEYKPTTRSEHGLDYSSLGAQQTYTSQYVGTQAQVPAGLPRSTALSMVPPAQQYSGPHDPVYNQHSDQQYAPQPAYLETSPRQAPEIISFAPSAGYQGSRVTVYFRSIYDFESPPIQTFLMFGTHRCQSTLTKTAQQNDMYQYELTADAPPFSVTSSPSPTPLRLLFDESLVQWSSPTLDVGSFTYLNTSLYNYLAASPETAQGASRKRKLSPRASPRRSPTKKPSFPQLPGLSRISQPYANTLPANTQIPQFRRPSLPEAYLQQRRVSSEYHPTYSTPAYSAPLPTTQQYYGGQLVGQTTPGLQPAPSPSWAYQHSGVPISRSPSTAAISVGERNPHLRPSPVGGSNPPLVRTSTLQQSPTTPASTIPTFNPYAIYPSNAKANLAIEGELASMADSWSTAEWEARRRLVQFSRSQTGSVISAKFEAVTPEARAPNSICVSCIWWTEKNECYVTSVDTIQLLEALVAVRFTVEEKNRIRRNLEGFRPATVSKAKADSEEFFKLIMGFPNPKPRNIEKDVKSASYSSTAGALHAPSAGPSYTATRNSDAGLGYDTAQAQQYQRATIGASPRSTSSSATSHAYAPAHTLVTTNAYSPHATGSIASSSAGLGQLPLPPDLRLAVPGAVAGEGGHQTTSWHQPSAHYADMAASTQQQNRDAWEYSSYISHSPATGLPGSAPSYGYQQQPMRLPSFSAQPAMSSEARFVPLHDYEDPGQPTTTA